MQSILKNYQVILESIEEGVFTVNQEWKLMSFNRSAERITGWKRSDAIGKPCHEVFKTDLCGNGCYLRKTLKTGVPMSNMPVFITRANGRTIPISVNTAVLKASDGKMIGGVEIFRDMTAMSELRKEFLKQYSFEDIVSKSEKILKYFSILPQIAESDSTLLIEGPTGTGKELFARAIHNHSTRKNGPFVAVNCGAIPDTLIESELFGYKAGAFTDARKDKPGRFTLARNGTIFLDEIGDTSAAVQVRLLRVLQEKQFEPLGASETVETNARVIVATHRDLEQRVKENRFREDLFYRVNVIRILLPPLSERKEDIGLLVDHFIQKFNASKGKNIIGLTQEAQAALMLYQWPGNVRELENAIEHAFILCPGNVIDLSHLPERIRPEGVIPDPPTGKTLKDIEKAAIMNALRKNGWKRMATARELGINKNTLRRKIEQYGLS